MSQSEHESPQSNKLDSATTDYSTSDREKIEQRSSVYWRYTHQNTQHAKALPSVLCKRKAMTHVSEEMKTKASDLDRLTEQIREKKDIGKYYI